jgi:uncharacterized protein (DUF427 family)
MTTETRSRVRIEPSPKRLRGYYGGELVFDTTAGRLVWEGPYYPAYYVPADDVRPGLLTPGQRTEHSPSRGDARYLTLTVGTAVVEDAAWRYPESPVEELRELIRFDWEALDHWFEEDEEVFVHPRDPYKRVDVLASSRHVQVEINGVTVADSHRPTLLFETSLPTRYYLPLTDVRLDLLRPSSRTSRCPYKGTAAYWSVQAGDELAEDVLWTYRTPVPESQKISGLVCFFNERVDLTVDSVRLERPRSPFSPRAGQRQAGVDT